MKGAVAFCVDQRTVSLVVRGPLTNEYLDEPFLLAVDPLRTNKSLNVSLNCLDIPQQMAKLIGLDLNGINNKMINLFIKFFRVLSGFFLA